MAHVSCAAAVCRIRSSNVILMQAPSSAYHMVCWDGEKLAKKRRRPQAILHQAAPVVLWYRPTRPHHVPLHLESGRGDLAAPQYKGGTRAISPGDFALPGGARRPRRMYLHLVLAGRSLRPRGDSRRPRPRAVHKSHPWGQGQARKDRCPQNRCAPAGWDAASGVCRSPHEAGHARRAWAPDTSATPCWVARCYDFSAALDHLVYTGGQLGRGPYLARKARSSQSSNSVSLLVKAPVAVYTA
jgi:hypothetical protein